jgi:hypothetical protein
MKENITQPTTMSGNKVFLTFRQLRKKQLTIAARDAVGSIRTTKEAEDIPYGSYLANV